jgi:hypothetical protein
VTLRREAEAARTTIAILSEASVTAAQQIAGLRAALAAELARHPAPHPAPIAIPEANPFRAFPCDHRRLGH